MLASCVAYSCGGASPACLSAPDDTTISRCRTTTLHKQLPGELKMLEGSQHAFCILNVLTHHTTSWRSPPSGMVVEHAVGVAGHCELRSSQWCLKHIDNYILVFNSCAQLVIHQSLQVQPGRLQPTAVACPDTQVQYRFIVRIQGSTGYLQEARVSVNFGRHLLQGGVMRQ